MAIYKDIEEITVDAIVSCMKVHISNVERYKMLSKYYDGDHKILGRTFDNPKIPNNKLVCNHAEYITDMATNYVFGNPVSYAGDGTDQLNELFTLIDEDSHNSELALDMSVFGLGHELIYMNEEQTPYPELAVMSPLNTFVVCDTSVKHKPIFAVTYRSKKENNKEIYIVDVYTKDEVITYETDGLTDKNYKTQGTVAHYFKDVRLLVFVRKDPEEFVHPFGGCRLQGLVCNFDHGFRRLIVNMGLFSRVTAALRARRCAGPVS